MVSLFLPELGTDDVRPTASFYRTMDSIMLPTIRATNR